MIDLTFSGSHSGTGAAGDISDIFAGVMTGLEELRRDKTKIIDRVEERAQQGQEKLRDELMDVISQARTDQAQLIRNTNQCLADSLALATKESEERENRITRDIERLMIDHGNIYAHTMTSLEKRLDATSDLMMRKLDVVLNGDNWEERPAPRRSNPEEMISERKLADVSMFMDGVKSDELKTMLARHFTLSLDQVPTPDDLRTKSRKSLLIKPRAENQYSNYGNYSEKSLARIPVAIDLVTTWIRGGRVRIVVRWTSTFPPVLLTNKT